MDDSDSQQTLTSSEPLNLEILTSRINNLTETHKICKDEISDIESQKLLKECTFHLMSKVNQIVSEVCSEIDLLGIEDMDAFLEHLKGELKKTEVETAEISNEIDSLSGIYNEELNLLESDLEELKYSLDCTKSKDLQKLKVLTHVDSSTYGEHELESGNIVDSDKFEILELNDQIETNDIILKSLQDFDYVYKRFEAIEKMEDVMKVLRIVDAEGNRIKFSLRTYLPDFEGLACELKVDDISNQLELNHELLIEVVDGTAEVKKVEIFPNDVYLGEIVDAAKSFRVNTRSSLEWLVRNVQDRIITYTLRRYVVKAANQSRHSFEYIDRDEMIVAHMVGRVNAFIKVSQGWPVLNSALKLISLKSSDNSSKGVSLSFLCKVEELANSLDISVRKNITSFVEAIENILVRQMRLEVQSGDNPQN